MAPYPTKAKRGSPPTGLRLELEERAVELSKRCPADHSNPAECPLCALRPMPLRVRRAWIQKLTDDELEYLAAYHAGCCAEKVAAKKPAKGSRRQ